jgi:hypothetical protein
MHTFGEEGENATVILLRDFISTACVCEGYRRNEKLFCHKYGYTHFREGTSRGN